MKSLIPFLCLFLSVVNSFGHPIPDLPVHGIFETDGTSKISLSIDIRCFEEDPEKVPFLDLAQFQALTQVEKENLLVKAKAFVRKSLQIRINQNEWYLPNFTFEFEPRDQNEFSEEDTLVFIHGFSNLTDPSGIRTYQIKALKEAPYDLVFTNTIHGTRLQRVNVLWPGEESFVLELESIMEPIDPNLEPNTKIAEPTSDKETESLKIPTETLTQSTFFSFLRQGFVHVLPLGLDHILFVLCIFLLSRKFRPLILQVSVFTLAHTITLALATLGIVSAPSYWVEPIIAASIAYVAIENIFTSGYRPHRLLIIFIFGLIHGLGFAGALSAFSLDPGSLAIGLLGFNLGVEFGQIAVLSIAFCATFWIKKDEIYKKGVVIPGSILIALIGTYWTMERIFF